MTEGTNEGTTPPETGPMFDAPDDVADDIATGYAVYDRTLGRFVGGVSADKPTAKAAREAAGGNAHSVVRV